MNRAKQNLLGLTREELGAFAESIGEPRYRGQQIFGWLYARGAREFRAMTDLGKAFRESLQNSAAIEGLSFVSREASRHDGTTKFLFELSDGLKIESVLIPPASAFRPGEATRDDEQTRLTLCVSTQVGCPLDCAFCATGTMGFSRNLTTGEIVDQILQALHLTGKRITNIVFMGMGEPMLNYDNVMRSLDIITHGIGIAARHITISTAGWADKIRQMGDEHRRAKLAVSLHSAVEETRSRLMPVTRRYPLQALLAAIEHYYRAVKLRVTYEFIFFEGVNDTDAEVARLIKFARRVPSKINVIPYHSIAFTGVQGFAASLRPSTRTEAIVDRLRSNNLTVMMRSSAGEDIAAACGQLAIKTLRRSRASVS